MDDCQSPKKSNEKSFTMGSISPSFGSLDGGNIIYIYGDFPYAATSDYVQKDLVAHFDGINNRGLGDKQHDFTETASWRDLKSEFDLPRGNGPGEWLSNGFKASDNDNDDYKYSFRDPNSFPSNFPAGNHARTIEVIFRTPGPDKILSFFQIEGNYRHVFTYGSTNEPGNIFAISYRGNTRPSDCGTDNPWVFYPIAANTFNLVSCLASTPSLTTGNTINTITSTYANSIQDADSTNSYINNHY
jgi:hypothetical protein